MPSIYANSVWDMKGNSAPGSVTKNDIVPETTSFTYNADGTILTVGRGGETQTFTYNEDGTIDTITNGVTIKTFVYNENGSIQTVLIS